MVWYSMVGMRFSKKKLISIQLAMGLNADAFIYVFAYNFKKTVSSVFLNDDESVPCAIIGLFLQGRKLFLELTRYLPKLNKKKDVFFQFCTNKAAFKQYHDCYCLSSTALL